MGCTGSQTAQVSAAKELDIPDQNTGYVTTTSLNEFSDNMMNSARSVGSPRSCCSFGYLIEQNENYQIYEYLFEDQIGKGRTTRVYQVKNVETNDIFAAKVYSKSLLTKQLLLSGNSAIQSIKEEIEIQSKLENKYIMAIIEIIEDEPSDSIIMIMPIAKYGNLVKYIETQHPDEKTIATCFYQIACAIDYIHSMNVCHRDIKPTNILVIEDDHFCLADFSCAKKLESPNEMLIDTKGTPAYLSPEECSGESFSAQTSDIWSYGLSIYYAIFGCLPFELDTVTGSELANLVFMVSKLLKAKELVIPECSDVLRDLLEKILVKDYTKRATIKEIINHPWFDQVRSNIKD